jgi:hypothetical protein
MTFSTNFVRQIVDRWPRSSKRHQWPWRCSAEKQRSREEDKAYRSAEVPRANVPGEDHRPTKSPPSSPTSKHEEKGNHLRPAWFVPREREREQGPFCEGKDVFAIIHFLQCCSENQHLPPRNCHVSPLHWIVLMVHLPHNVLYHYTKLSEMLYEDAHQRQLIVWMVQSPLFF